MNASSENYCQNIINTDNTEKCEFLDYHDAKGDSTTQSEYLHNNQGVENRSADTPPIKKRCLKDEEIHIIEKYNLIASISAIELMNVSNKVEKMKCLNENCDQQLKCDSLWIKEQDSGYNNTNTYL
uniref:Uncharacterized protein n=1 Tax=Trichobilharzia regenti TaxID=157069 RepID=A0AA85JT23_TRIRE|nr:unnamed protein product [Trichobilharzia regenti]CAH8824773.1 unnamed protein product [Trichobilharzia regenti]